MRGRGEKLPGEFRCECHDLKVASAREQYYLVVIWSTYLYIIVYQRDWESFSVDMGNATEE